MEKKINLFCFPFAGGNRYSYKALEKHIPSFLNVITLEYPGRGNRIKEDLLTNIEHLVDDLYQQMIPLINGETYAIYGHSMGGLIGYLITQKIICNHHLSPKHIFITGTSGPSAISRTEKKRYLLNKEEFINEIKDLNGCPNEILENEEMLNFMEPILRADFQASETYQYFDKGPINIPLTIITGIEEDIEIGDIHLWQNETTELIKFRRLPGNHFFIFQHPFQIIEIITKEILKAKVT